MNLLLRLPYAALGAIAELVVALAPDATASGGKVRRALSARRGLYNRFRAFSGARDTSRPLVWFHAPSVGETLMALPVMHALRIDSRKPQLAFTWFSPSAEPFAARVDADFRDYLPLDTASGAECALDVLRPDVLVYSKLDVWPVLTERAAARGVALGLIAASLGERSGRRRAVARALLGNAYASLDFVGAVSRDDAARLIDLGARDDAVTVTGDTRYDQVWSRIHRLDRTQPPVSLFSVPRPTIVAGSTWPDDERVLLDAWPSIRQRVPDARLIIAPHEPTAAHLAPIRAWAERSGARLATLGESAVSTADVVLVDRVGVLAELYSVGAAAVVGGGFGRAGLHSVVEPAAFGLPVTFGPLGRWNHDAAGLLEAGGATIASDASAMAETLIQWLLDREKHGKASAAAAVFVRAGLGATERSLSLVLNALDNRGGKGKNLRDR